jgi:hypothetical protein
MERFQRCICWGFVLAGLTAYWSLAGFQIVIARESSDPKHFEWIVPVLLTAPVSLLSMFVEPPPEWQRAWFTFFAAAGAQADGLFMVWIVRRRMRRRTPKTANERDGEIGNYDERPIDGAPTFVD